MIAETVRSYLHRHGVQYEVFHHPKRSSSFAKATSSHVPPQNMIKAVLLTESTNQFALVLISADRMLSLFHVRAETGRNFKLASEAEIQRVFFDCVPGAIPAFGHAYELETLVDERLMHRDQLFFESGDQRSVLQISHTQFSQLVQKCEKGPFSIIPDLCPQFG